MPKFTIVGNHEVDGVEPGGTITLDDPQRIKSLTRGGHIAPAPKPAKKKAPVKKAPAETFTVDAAADAAEEV